MKLTLILLLFLWDNVELTLTHEECAELPTVEHAFVLDEYKKPLYQKGDVIYFSCDPGHTTGLKTTYICTEYGWSRVTYGQCIIKGTFPVRLGCTRPPALKNGHVLRNTALVYSDGQNARYQCNHHYVLNGGLYKTCSNGQWIGDIQCQEITCELPGPNLLKVRVPVGSRITVQCEGDSSSEQVECLPSGQWSSTFPTCRETCEVLPIPDSVLVYPRNTQQLQKLQKGQSLQFCCKDSRHVLHGAERVTCLEDGQWSHAFPSCTDVILVHSQNCGPPPPLDNGHYSSTTTQFDHGARVEYQCQSSHIMIGGPYKTCIRGEWTGEIRCLKTCEVLPIPDSVLVYPRITQQLQKLQKGQSLQFRCKDSRHVLHGAERVTCLEDGQWSHTFPSCTAPQSCGAPPALNNGDFFTTSTQFGNNARVQYQCQDKYVMQGGPYKTCLNGQWTGKIRCLEPCTVNPVLMEIRKIRFAFEWTNKPYARHNDNVTFACVPGARHIGRVQMRQICFDGVMVLPTCF